MHPGLTRSLRWVGLLEAGRKLELSVRRRESRALPGALLIGAMKCGTSSLHNYLTQHPHVIAPLRKEVHYFDLHYEQGERWYRANFGRSTEPGLNIDSSPYYLLHPAVPERARALLPEARLLVLLRDPVRRAYSHYWHERDKGRETLSFEDAIAAESNRTAADHERLARGELARSTAHRYFSYLARGRYAEQLQRWLQHYPREQMLILRFEDLAQDPLTVLNRSLAFLGLPAVAHARLEARNTRIYPPMSAATSTRLREYFEPHNQPLETLLGSSPGWP